MHHSDAQLCLRKCCMTQTFKPVIRVNGADDHHVRERALSTAHIIQISAHFQLWRSRLWQLPGASRSMPSPQGDQSEPKQALLPQCSHLQRRCAGTPYRASRSYSNLGQVISDSESGTPFVPSASSPLAPPRHQRSVSTTSNGAFASSTLTSPFDTQGGPLRRLNNALNMQAHQQMGLCQQHPDQHLLTLKVKL